MKLIFFLIVIILSAQKEVTIYNAPDDTKVALLEAEIVKNIFKLYNVHNSNDKLTYRVTYLKTFDQVFEALDNTENKDYSFSMCQITITAEREEKYDFSIPFIPIKESVYTLKSREDKEYKKDGVKIAYQKGSTQEEQITNLEKYKIVPVVFDIIRGKIESLRKKDVDFVIGDNIEVWGKTDLVIVENMDTQSGSGVGFLYSKSSKLRKKLDPYIKKYISSQSFINYLIRDFGKDVANYYKENIKEIIK
jgi:ABC-type amino acid transport substrate-binding protein